MGGLLGDVFLNLLPQAWSSDLADSSSGKCYKIDCFALDLNRIIFMNYRRPSIDAKWFMGFGRRSNLHNHRENLFGLCECRRKQSTAKMCGNRQLFVTEERRKNA